MALAAAADEKAKGEEEVGNRHKSEPQIAAERELAIKVPEKSAPFVLCLRFDGAFYYFFGKHFKVVELSVYSFNLSLLSLGCCIIAHFYPWESTGGSIDDHD